MKLWRIMGHPISQWFCAVHPHEFLIFGHHGRQQTFCPQCKREAAS